jgi:hypothetical protein
LAPSDPCGLRSKGIKSTLTVFHESTFVQIMVWYSLGTTTPARFGTTVIISLGPVLKFDKKNLLYVPFTDESTAQKPIEEISARTQLNSKKFLIWQLSPRRFKFAALLSPGKIDRR